MNSTTIYFRPTIKARRAQMVNDILPGFLLLLSGIDGVTNPGAPHREMAWVNLLAGAICVVTVIREWRTISSERHHLVNRIDLFVGIVLFIEGLNRYKSWKGFQPAYGYFLVGVFTIVRGLLHTRFPKLRRLTIDEKGLCARTSPFHKIGLRWSEIFSIITTETGIAFRSHDGRIHRLNMRRVQNRDEVTVALKEAATMHNLEFTETSVNS